MDFEPPDQSVLERVRTRWVVARLERRRFRTTTEDFARFRRMEDIAFYVMLVICLVGLVGLLFA